MNEQEYVNTVDESDNVIGKKLRTGVTKTDITRIAALWVFDIQKNLLIAQRPTWKKHDPEKWTESLVGTVEYDETYESNLVKEAKEELNLSVTVNDLVFITKEYFENQNGRYFASKYALTLDSLTPPITPDKDEVPAVEWISHNKLIQELEQKGNRFVEHFDELYKDVWNKIANI